MEKKHVLGSALILTLLLAACAPTAGPSVSPKGPDQTTAPAPTALPTPAPPTSYPRPTAEPTVPTQEIVLEAPAAGATVSSPVEVRGRVAIVPFESTLLGRVYDADGRIIGAGPIMVEGSMGDQGPKPFSGSIAFSAAAAGPGRVEVAELSPKDDSVIASAAVEVVLAGGTLTDTIEVPAAGVTTTLPLHILARVGRPGEEVVAALRWEDGSLLTRTYTLRQGEDGRGLLIESLWWAADIPPLPFPPTQPAVLEIRRPDGAVLVQQPVRVASWDDDRNTTKVTVYFLLGEELQAVERIVPRTVRVGTAALEELLWGPPPPNLAGLGTALPGPDEVLAYPGRAPDWGPRVRLLSLTIVDGVATADFSQELRAYGGGSLRVMLIRQQITRTLLEFPSVREVVIAIEGETEAVLEP